MPTSAITRLSLVALFVLLMMTTRISMALFWTLTLALALGYAALMAHRLLYQEHRRWTQTARALGLKHTPRSLPLGLKAQGPITGTRNGLHIHIDTHKALSPKRPLTITLVDVHFAQNLGLGLRITANTTPQTAPNTPRILLGDHDFDDAFIVTGNDPNTIARTLTPQVRRALLDRVPLHNQLSIDDKGVHQIISGAAIEPYLLTGIIERHTQLASLIQQASAPLTAKPATQPHHQAHISARNT